MKNMKSFSIINGKEASEKHVRQSVEIDALVYKEDYQGIYEQCIEWFKKNPEIYTFLVDDEDGSVAAYVNAMPITESLHDKIMNSELLDVNIDTADILEYKPGEEYILYFCSIVVRPDYQGTKAFSTLYDAFTNHMIDLYERGILFKKVIAEGVTTKGARICRLSGLHEISKTTSGSILYSLQLPEGRFLPLSSTGEKLKELISRVYE